MVLAGGMAAGINWFQKVNEQIDCGYCYKTYSNR